MSYRCRSVITSPYYVPVAAVLDFDSAEIKPAQCCIKSHHISLLGPRALIRCDDLPATITHVPVAAVLVLNTPDDGRLRPKHVE